MSKLLRANYITLNNLLYSLVQHVKYVLAYILCDKIIFCQFEDIRASSTHKQHGIMHYTDNTFRCGDRVY